MEKKTWAEREEFWKGEFLVPSVYTCFVDVLVVSDPCISINKYHIEYTNMNMW